VFHVVTQSVPFGVHESWLTSGIARDLLATVYQSQAKTGRLRVCLPAPVLFRRGVGMCREYFPVVL